MRTHSAILLTLGLCVSLLAVASPSATAHTRRWGTSSSFGMTASGGKAALGTVTSKKAACVKNRKVKLFMVRPGKKAKQIGVDRRTGAPSGNGDGYWVIPANLKKGKRYYAVITQKNIGPKGHKHLCRKYRTSTLPF